MIHLVRKELRKWEQTVMTTHNTILQFNKSKLNTNNKETIILTLFSVSAPTTAGPANPGIVAPQLVIPINTPAYCGAMSRWLTLQPDMVNPAPRQATQRNITARTRSQPT